MPGLTPKQLRFVECATDARTRFDAFVDRSAGPDGCWPWTGARSPVGYGRFALNRAGVTSAFAHRVAFAIATGEAPEAVCHRCDNPPCCNPRHLFGGTRGDNNRDMTAKGRHGLAQDPSRAARGSGHGSAKLDEVAARAIRDRYASGGVTQRALAEEYRVSQRTIAKIVLGIGWIHA